ncbi:aldo/keto reductase [Brachybacterium sp. EF45031]|uniref:aldo/keto reductase n=1 Tax=Brachybacterium sillae TaxID=2810536 RepID=UPI00217EAD93|nr:aldo/keto reductase [Brachybacterium sillae]MCS6711937.1 aldo/keto reductase [Brachybacterium sillae]
MSTVPTLRFHDGREIPQLGFGVWQVEDEVAEKVVGEALKVGYRHIDTAAIYGNEAGVGRALAASDVAREDVFVTTKLWNDSHRHDDAVAALDTSLEKLGLDYVDLYLIHWAKPKQGQYLDAWRTLIELQKTGKVKSIGVSNFPQEQLEEIIEATGVKPVIHQIELHPHFQQADLRAYGRDHGILTEAWSPLGQGKDVLTDPVITEIAEAKGATPAQVVIAWHLAIGNVVIPKSVTPERIVSNFEATSVSLTEDEVRAIGRLDSAEGRIGPDPAECDF